MPCKLVCNVVLVRRQVIRPPHQISVHLSAKAMTDLKFDIVTMTESSLLRHHKGAGTSQDQVLARGEQ